MKGCPRHTSTRCTHSLHSCRTNWMVSRRRYIKTTGFLLSQYGYSTSLSHRDKPLASPVATRRMEGTRKGGESRVTTTSDSSPPLYSLSRTHRSTSRTLKVAAAVCYNNISSKSLVVLLLVAVLCWCRPHHCHIHHWRLYRDSRQHTHTLSLHTRGLSPTCLQQAAHARPQQAARDCSWLLG